MRVRASRWRGILGLLLLCGACRLRQVEQRKSTTVMLPAEDAVGYEAILPGAVASQVLAAPQRRSAAALLVVGFGALDFSAVRNAQREAQRVLRSAEGEGDASWNALSDALHTLTLRRSWQSEAARWGRVSISSLGSAEVEHSGPGDRVGDALLALSVKRKVAPTVLEEEELKTDWSLLTGPLVSLLRLSNGEYGVLATGEPQREEVRLAVDVSDEGAAVVLCACEPDLRLEPLVAGLGEVLGNGSELRERAKAVASELEERTLEKGRFAVLALTGELVLAESSHKLVYGTAGDVLLGGRVQSGAAKGPTPPPHSLVP